MYLRATTRKKDGKVHRYWRLVESVRIGRRVIQRTVAQLGELDGEGRVKARALSRHLIGAPEQTALFDDGHEHVTVPVRLKGIRIERARQFGDVSFLRNPAPWSARRSSRAARGASPAGRRRTPPPRSATAASSNWSPGSGGPHGAPQSPRIASSATRALYDAEWFRLAFLMTPASGHVCARPGTLSTSCPKIRSQLSLRLK